MLGFGILGFGLVEMLSMFFVVLLIVVGFGFFLVIVLGIFVFRLNLFLLGMNFLIILNGRLFSLSVFFVFFFVLLIFSFVFFLLNLLIVFKFGDVEVLGFGLVVSSEVSSEGLLNGVNGYVFVGVEFMSVSVGFFYVGVGVVGSLSFFGVFVFVMNWLIVIVVFFK